MTEFEFLCKKAGFQDLRVKDNHKDVSLQRQGIFFRMRLNGNKIIEIAKQSERSTATVIYGIRAFHDLLGTGDEYADAVWHRINNGVEIN